MFSYSVGPLVSPMYVCVHHKFTPTSQFLIKITCPHVFCGHYPYITVIIDLLNIVIPYSGKYLQDKIFTNFAVCLTSAKILSVNEAFSLFCRVILASIRENFICEFSFLGPSVKILSREYFPLYGNNLVAIHVIMVLSFS